MANQKFELFKVNDYAIDTNRYIKIKSHTPLLIDNIDELTSLLERKDNGYHFRIHKDTQYTFFCDIDGLQIDIEEFFNILIDFLKTYYYVNVTIDDISYTQNKSKEGSYHISIININASCEKIKEILMNFKSIYPDISVYILNNKTINVIDTSIFSEHWFRYPNQSKEQKEGTFHYIIKGEMIDFVQEYIKTDSININDQIYIKKKTEKKIEINMNEIEKNLVNVDYSLIHDRNEWLKFGSCLKTCGFTADDFCKYSQNMANHSPCTCHAVYKGLQTSLYKNPILVLSKFLKVKELESKQLMDIVFYLKSFGVYSDLDHFEKIAYEACKDTVFIFMSGVTAYVAIKKDYSHENQTQSMEISAFSSFQKAYSNIVITFGVEDKKQSMPLPSLLFNIQKLCYSGFYIKPYHPFESNEKSKNGWLNVFSPMISKRLEKYDISKIDLILQHIKKVWANDDEFIYKYILSYFHNMIKTPWKRSKICLVLCGEQGSGKSIIVEMMIKHIFGTNCAHQTQGLKSICSRFQGWLENKLLVLAEEPTQMTDMNFSEYVEKLKDFITSNTCEIEKKGIDKYIIDAFHTLIITCNHLKGIHVPNEQERRYMILNCNGCYIGNTSYFVELDKILDNKDMMDIFFNFLYDYEDTVPLHPIPVTQIKKDLINDNKSTVEKFLFDPENKASINFTDQTLNLKSLYIEFHTWCDIMGYNKNFRLKKDAFDKEMAKFGVSKVVSIKGEKLRVFRFNTSFTQVEI